MTGVKFLPGWLLVLLWAIGMHSAWAASEYHLSPEDVVSINVFDEPELTVAEIRVSTTGTVSMPLLGDISVRGKTTAQAAQAIHDLLADGYLKNPRVVVTIKQYRQIFVNGAVKEPGGYPYQEGLTVQRAVVLAGGFTERASDSAIEMIREDNPDQSFPVRLTTLVRPGDIITVGESFF